MWQLYIHYFQLLGMALMYCIRCYRNWEHYAVSQRQEENIQLGGPVYEEVTPIQEGIELKLMKNTDMPLNSTYTS